MNPTFAYMNKIPGSRQFLKQILAFFSNFDDIWLYNYHAKKYDNIIMNFFCLIQQL